MSGTVSLLDTRSGTLLRTTRVGESPQALAVDARTGRVFVATAGTGTISLLDARSGALLRTITLGDLAVDLAVDEQTSRVVVRAACAAIRWPWRSIPAPRGPSWPTCWTGA